MKIENVTKCECFIVETDEGKYIRYNSENWMKEMGSDDITVSDNTELEKLYEDWVFRNGGEYY